MKQIRLPLIAIILFNCLVGVYSQNTSYAQREKGILDTISSINLPNDAVKGKHKLRTYVRAAKFVLKTDTLKYMRKQKHGRVKEWGKYKTRDFKVKYMRINDQVVSASITLKSRDYKSKTRYFRNSLIVTIKYDRRWIQKFYNKSIIYAFK